MSKLKEMRTARGLSQSQLAEKAGIKVRSYQAYEQGTASFDRVHMDTILRICLALECKMEDVLTDPELLELLKQYREMVDKMA
ncbi:MAG: helix-turn-helix transcriptional regulator [Eubacteriaceae bacterium]|nr:helix-turn-helix transcriptional regulator [Eubacteriaceae bacterium]